MENFWTSNESINGLRHFVLVNKIEGKEVGNLMVSVVDVEISFMISNEELFNIAQWTEGWLDFSKSESITKDYLKFKLSNNSKEGTNKILINKNSIFNIS